MKLKLNKKRYYSLIEKNYLENILDSLNLEKNDYIKLISGFIIVGIFYFSSNKIYDLIKDRLIPSSNLDITKYETIINIKPFKEISFNYERFIKMVDIKPAEQKEINLPPLTDLKKPNTGFVEKKLEAIYIAEDSKFVIINGKIMKEGDKYMDFKVIKIMKDRVLIEQNGETKWLNLID
ncbi:hypothetical protein JCM14244_06670 [Venenivibrio stagnispumantis]|uniref:Uncharacterized protein n=1 Tax=Venenivibrio stagnispumantis TaxID=407998 RepID=A0AA46ACR2_9AQUI|nr:hypothetical protein [Venenivibrio stagnispumantis]MCW4572611.1 hypothetical protein [Venenivibrio stagnispumantis]SMP00556.1 hypothetical protein SAMN06264868_101126 [Venenivibrio stagnispumantis]